MKPDGVYVYSLIEGELHLRRLHRRGAAAAARGRSTAGTLTEDGDPLGQLLRLRACRGSTISQVKHPVVSADDSNPRISWGRYTERGGRDDAARLASSSTTRWPMGCTSRSFTAVSRRSCASW